VPSHELRALIEARAPRRPWNGPDKNRARVRPLAVALQEPYLQLDPPCQRSFLIFDIDRRGAALAWELASLPPPSWIAINPLNAHAHLGYALEAPVCTTDAARRRPLAYLAAIEAAFHAAMGADLAFHGPLCKNPLHPRWRLWEPANAPMYELDELAEYVELGKALPRTTRRAGLSRNCDLFDALRVWAYRAVREHWRPGGADAWGEAVLRRAHALNDFPVPLPFNEVRSIGRSVARYVWRHMTPQGFRERQAALGRLSAQARRQASTEARAQALELFTAGSSKAAIARELDVPRPTIVRWLEDATWTRPLSTNHVR
jgi:hypothetical protein